uniref:Uncharacterized protein n=1 Tax=Panagrolaimus sp. PS1159 TaxID=55785 RepID=A0AC35GGV7_9BILA
MSSLVEAATSTSTTNSNEMLSYFGVIYIYLLLFIVIFVIILSVTGRSTGVRERAADILLATFE